LSYPARNSWGHFSTNRRKSTTTYFPPLCKKVGTCPQVTALCNRLRPAAWGHTAIWQKVHNVKKL